MTEQESSKKTSIDIIEIKMSRMLERKYQIVEKRLSKTKRSLSPIRKYNKVARPDHPNKIQHKIISRERIDKEGDDREYFIFIKEADRTNQQKMPKWKTKKSYIIMLIYY